MKLENVDAVWDIRAAEFDVVIAEVKVGGLRIAFGVSGRDALKFGRAFVAAGKGASSWKRAGTSRRIATQLLKKAARR